MTTHPQSQEISVQKIVCEIVLTFSFTNKCGGVLIFSKFKTPNQAPPGWSIGPMIQLIFQSFIPPTALPFFTPKSNPSMMLENENRSSIKSVVYSIFVSKRYFLMSLACLQLFNHRIFSFVQINDGNCKMNTRPLFVVVNFLAILQSLRFI